MGRRGLALASAGALALFAADAAAQVAGSVEPAGTAEAAGEVEEVVVTARRREEAIGDVPFAVTVLGAQDLRERRVDDTLSLFRQAPGLSLTSFDEGRFAYFQLRGIGPLSQAISPDDASVVTYVNGVPQPAYAAEFAYLDLERIEILRGPQGTLYGRNAQGGVINIITRQPDETARTGFRLEAAQNDYGLAETSLSGPLAAGRLYGSVSARLSTIGGFVPNLAPIGGDLGDREVRSGRATLVYTPDGAGGPRFALALNADRQESSPFYYALRSAPGAPKAEIDPENKVDRTLWGASLTAEAPLRGAVLHSITAFNGFHNDQFTDDTDGLIYGALFGVPSSAFLPRAEFSDWRERERRFYQELRVNSPPGAPVSWVAGATYFRSDFDVLLKNRSSFSPFLNGDRDNEQRVRSYAVFGEVTAPLGSRRLEGTAGLRYTRDDKAFEGRFTGASFPGTVPAFSERDEASFDLLTGRGALRYAATEDLDLYATVGRGAKSGGFARFTLNAALGNPSPPYAESTSWTYEAGAKARLLGGRASLNLAVFRNEVNDEQLFILDFVTFQFLPANLDIRSSGLEVEGRVRLMPGLQLSGGLAWTDAELTEAGASGARAGNRVPNVAAFSTTATLSYIGPAGALGFGRAEPVATLTHQYAGERSADVAESFELPGYHNIDARLGLRFGELELYAFGRNLTDEQPQLNGVLYGPGVEAAAYGRGRVLGIGLTERF